MDSVLKRIERKCEEAKKKLVLISHKRKRKSIIEPYMRELTRGNLGRR
jgi:hypothetical protein